MQSSTEMNDQTVAEVAVESVVAAKMNTVSDKPVACKVTMISGKKKAARNVLTRMEGKIVPIGFPVAWQTNVSTHLVL